MRKIWLHPLSRKERAGVFLKQEKIPPNINPPPYRYCSSFFWLIAFLVLLIIGSVTLTNAVAARPTAPKAFGAVSKISVQHWIDFRKKQHFHIQVVAVSKVEADGTRTLIISEPPPGVSWNDLVKTLRPYAKECGVGRHYVMFNGWTYDVICTLKPADNATLANLIANLHLLMFGTVYGAQAVQLPVTAAPILGPSLDFRFAGDELYRWLVEENLKFQPLSLTAPVTLNDIMEKKLRGVFITSSKGLVLWVIDRNGSIDDEGANIRRFAVAGDLILGAIADRDSVALVARKRLETTERMPPLRAETVKLLAGIRERKIQQSYERNHLLSSKDIDGIDRAPILLSPELVDTELGSLLNITDQLLKCWSSAGLVDYADFPYPQPGDYPFGATPALKVEKNRHQFLFNWNTDGTTYIQSRGNYDLAVPERTGSLSIIYGDVRDRPRAMENTAYEYFARQGDANIARVLQYSTIYQIFQYFKITAAQPPISPRYALFQSALRKATEKVLQKLDPDEQLTRDLAVLLANPRETGEKLDEHDPSFTATFMRAAQILKLKDPEMIFEIPKRFQDKREVAFAKAQTGTWKSLEAVDAPRRTSWIRTAYVVASSPRGIVVKTVGGHDINAAMSQLKASNLVPPGSISIARDPQGRLTVLYNAQDKGRLRDISRLVGTRKGLSTAEIERQVNAQLGKIRPAEPVRLAELSARTPAHAEIPGFRSIAEIKPGMVRGKLNNNQIRLLADMKDVHHPTIVVEQAADGTYLIMTTGGSEVIAATTVPAMTDALTLNMLRGSGLGSPVTVVVRGIPAAKAEAILAHVNDNIRRLPRGSAEAILISGESPDLGAAHLKLANYKIARNGIKIDPNISRRVLTEGPYKGSVELTVNMELPTPLTERGPRFLRAFFITKESTQGFISSLYDRLRLLIAGMKPEVSPTDIGLAVKYGLKQDFKSMGVENVMIGVGSSPERQNYDLFISRLPYLPVEREG